MTSIQNSANPRNCSPAIRTITLLHKLSDLNVALIQALTEFFLSLIKIKGFLMITLFKIFQFSCRCQGPQFAFAISWANFCYSIPIYPVIISLTLWLPSAHSIAILLLLEWNYLFPPLIMTIIRIHIVTILRDRMRKQGTVIRWYCILSPGGLIILSYREATQKNEIAAQVSSPNPPRHQELHIVIEYSYIGYNSLLEKILANNGEFPPPCGFIRTVSWRGQNECRRRRVVGRVSKL